MDPSRRSPCQARPLANLALRSDNGLPCAEPDGHDKVVSDGARFMSAKTYSPQEATVITGLSLGAIQKAITARQIPASVDRSRRRRRIGEGPLLALALANRLPHGVSLSVREAHKLLTRHGIDGADKLAFVNVGGAVRIDLRETLSEAV